MEDDFPEEDADLNNYAHLTVPEKLSDYIVYCPACGTGILVEGGCQGCPHVVFNHARNPEDDDFYHIASRYYPIVRKAQKAGEDALAAVVKALDKRPSVFIFAIHYTDDAGKEVNLVTTAIDYAPKAPDTPTRAKRKK